MVIKFHSSKSILNTSKIFMLRVISDNNAPSCPVKIACNQSLNNIFFQPRVWFRIKFWCFLNILNCQNLLVSEIRKLICLVIESAFTQEVCDVVVKIVVATVLVVYEHQFRLDKHVQIIKVIMTKPYLSFSLLLVFLNEQLLKLIQIFVLFLD